MIYSSQKTQQARLRLFLAAFVASVLLMMAHVTPSVAASKTWALSAAAQQQRFHCGDGFWWVCYRSQAPYPFCYASGRRGAWNCYGGVTQRGAVSRWRWRNCAVYTYVAVNGRSYTNGLYNCR